MSQKKHIKNFGVLCCPPSLASPLPRKVKPLSPPPPSYIPPPTSFLRFPCHSVMSMCHTDQLIWSCHLVMSFCLCHRVMSIRHVRSSCHYVIQINKYITILIRIQLDNIYVTTKILPVVHIRLYYHELIK